MPNFQGHLVGGAVSFALVFGILLYAAIPLPRTPFGPVYWLMFTMLGSLFPDIDIHSKGQRLLYMGLLVGCMWAIMGQHWRMLFMFTSATFFPIAASHRGVTHHLWFIIFVPLALLLTLGSYYPSIKEVGLYPYLFFVTGALSHLILDFGPTRFIARSFFMSTRRFTRTRK